MRFERRTSGDSGYSGDLRPQGGRFEARRTVEAMGFNTAVRKEDGCVALEVDTSFFCEEAILKTAYQFTER